MRYKLYSRNNTLNVLLNSEAFTDYNGTTITSSTELVVGDNLSLTDNYYEQIPLKIVSRTFARGLMWLEVENIPLSVIDPYVYGEQSTFKLDVIKASKSEIVKSCVDAKIKEYGEDASDNKIKLKRYATMIDDALGISKNSPIDCTNLWYRIEEILAKEWNVEWHRPYHWEYSDM